MMNDRAKIVLWLGLAMILVAIVRDWPVIKADLFGNAGPSWPGGLGNAPHQLPTQANGKCPPGYNAEPDPKTGGTVCVLHAALPM